MARSRLRSIPKRFLSFAALAVLLTSVPTATAQPSSWSSFQGRMGSGGLEPDLLRRDLQSFDEALRLDTDQAAILSELFLDYELQTRQRIEVARAEMQAAVPDQRAIRNDRHETQRMLRLQMTQMMETARERSNRATSQTERDRIWKEHEVGIMRIRNELRALASGPVGRADSKRIQDAHLRIVTAWQDEQSRITDDLLLSTYSLLTEEQQARWPALERTLRRDKTLPDGELAQESLNLFSILRGLDIPLDVPAVDELLQQYAVQLDEALKRRNEFLAESREAFVAAMRDGDEETVQRLGDRQVELRVAVRDVNQRHQELFAEVLPAADAAAFAGAANEAAFTKVYRPTRAGRMIRSSLGLNGLHAETIEALIALEAEYLAGLATINQRLCQLTRVHEPERLKIRFERMARQERQTRYVRHDDALEDEFRRRSSYESQFIDRLRSIVPAELFAGMAGAGARGMRQPGGVAGSEGVGLANQQWAMQFDADGDGRLSAEELEALKAVLRNRPPPE